MKHQSCILKEVVSKDDFETMRRLRNQAAHFMTANKSEISESEQEAWQTNLDRRSIIPYLLYVMKFGVVAYPVGYGLLKVFNNHCELTAAIDENERGKGYGRKIFEMLIEEAAKCHIPPKIILHVLQSNTVALNLYESLGFKKIDEKDNILYLELEP